MKKSLTALLFCVVWVLGSGISTVGETTHAHYYGVVRSLSTGWILIDDANHTPVGLHSPYCMPDTGELRITYTTPLVTVGTANVTMDETYAGKVFGGPSVGLEYIYLTWRINGSTVHCSSSTLRTSSNANAFVEVIGETA